MDTKLTTIRTRTTTLISTRLVLKYYPTAILLSGGVGAFLNREGDLRDKMFGFGKGAVAGWAIVTLVKTLFGI